MILFAFCLLAMFLINVTILGVISRLGEDGLSGVLVVLVLTYVMFYGQAHVIDWLINTKEILK